MKIMGTGHAACTVGETLVVFDRAGFVARGGDPAKADYIAEHGTLDGVPDDIAATLVQLGLAIAMAEPEKAEKTEKGAKKVTGGAETAD